jgi:hypothetical protein
MLLSFPETNVMNPYESRKANRLKLQKKVKDRIRHLYDVERRRPDDVYQIVADEFCISVLTVQRIYKTKNPSA